MLVNVVITKTLNETMQFNLARVHAANLLSMARIHEKTYYITEIS